MPRQENVKRTKAREIWFFRAFFTRRACLEKIRFQKIIDGTTQRFYVNGQEVGNPLDGQGFSPNDVNPLRIGGGATEDLSRRRFVP